MKTNPLLNQVPHHEDIWRQEVQLHIFLASTEDGGDCSASYPSHFTLIGIDPSTYWIRNLVDPRDSLDAVTKKKIPFITHTMNCTPVIQPIA
jgi:hypothetical protein